MCTVRTENLGGVFLFCLPHHLNFKIPLKGDCFPPCFWAELGHALYLQHGIYTHYSCLMWYNGISGPFPPSQAVSFWNAETLVIVLSPTLRKAPSFMHICCLRGPSKLCRQEHFQQSYIHRLERAVASRRLAPPWKYRETSALPWPLGRASNASGKPWSARHCRDGEAAGPLGVTQDSIKRTRSSEGCWHLSWRARRLGRPSPPMVFGWLAFPRHPLSFSSLRGHSLGLK